MSRPTAGSDVETTYKYYHRPPAHCRAFANCLRWWWLIDTHAGCNAVTLFELRAHF